MARRRWKRCPKVAGRLESVSVRLGDRVSRGQTLAKIEDGELREQIRQAAGVVRGRQRRRFVSVRRISGSRRRISIGRRNLFERQLIPKQTFDDAEARYQAAAAQLDLAKAQHSQAQARLDELKINLANTMIVSPVNGFIGKRTLDPGAWVTPNSALLSVVDISVVRLVANIVEKDLAPHLRRDSAAGVEVDAFPDEKFGGRIARVSPVLDPATRTAQIEVEIDEPAVPPEARDVRAGRTSRSNIARTPWSFPRTRSSTCRASAACSCPPARRATWRSFSRLASAS